MRPLRAGSRPPAADRLAGPWPTRLLTLAVLLSSGGAGLAYTDSPGAVVDALGRAGGFDLRLVKLEGQKETSDSAIVAAVGLEPGATLLTIDPEAMRERLERLPWVTEATVRKVLPGKLDVTIKEAVPYARWRDRGVEVLVAEDGEVLSDDVPYEFAELPLVVGPGANTRAKDARAILDAYPDVGGRTTAALLVGGRRWDLLMYSGATVRLPEDGAGDALARLADLEEEGALVDMGKVVIDMRLPDRTSVQLKPSGNGLIEIAPEGQGGGEEPQDLLAQAIAEANAAPRLEADPVGALLAATGAEQGGGEDADPLTAVIEVTP